MRFRKREHRGDRRSLRFSRATVGSSGPRATGIASQHRTRRCVRSGRDGQAPSGERRADAVRRTRREGRAGRGAGIAATKHRTSFADAGGGSGRPANGSEAEDGPQGRRADATNSTRSRQRGALRGRSGADRLPDEASWAGLRPAADLAVAARPSGRPSRPPGSVSTVAPKRATRRQAIESAEGKPPKSWAKTVQCTRRSVSNSLTMHAPTRMICQLM